MQENRGTALIEMTEDELLKALKLSEEDPLYKKAVRHLYDSYHPFLMRYLRGNHQLEEEECKDIGMQTLVNLLHNIRRDRYREEANLKNFLRGIADKIVLNHFRKKKREQNHIREFLHRYQEAESASPEHLYLSREIRNQVNRLLNRLGERCRKILRLYAQDYSYAIIAEQLGYANAAAVRVVALRCRRNLEALFDKEQLQ